VGGRGRWDVAGPREKNLPAAAELFGKDSTPIAIILTHAHFDHVGAVKNLLMEWDVPVYAHELELPYLTGLSDYPPPDPVVGGGMFARMSPLFSRKGIDIRHFVRPLPEDGAVPGLPSWRWIHTPGHTPGHVSFFRDMDRTLIAGDAFVTVKNESLLAVLSQKQQVSRPPAYFTTDWLEAKRSVEVLAKLEPEIAATGHGVPMSGIELRYQLETMAINFEERAIPRRGRYVKEPAIADHTGVRYIPPAAFDPVPKLVGLAAAGLAALYIVRKVRRGRKEA